MTDAPSRIMKLFYAPGSCSLAPHIALREADRRFELERVELRARVTASGIDYLTINPKGYVPALQLDGPDSMVLTEIAAIVLYVADLAPERRIAPPAGTFARYHVVEWLSFIGTEIHKQFSPLFDPDTPAFTEERLRTTIDERFGYVDHVLAHRSFVMGETFTVADCYLVPMLRWCERFEIDMAAWRNLIDYFDRLQQRPAVHAALAAEGLVEHKRVRRTA